MLMMFSFICLFFLTFISGQELTPAQKTKARELIKQNPDALTRDLPPDQKAKREQILRDNPDLLDKGQDPAAKPAEDKKEITGQELEGNLEEEWKKEQEEDKTAEEEEIDEETPEAQTLAQPGESIYGRGLFQQNYRALTSPDVPEDYIIVEGDQILLRLWGRYNLEKIYTVGSDGYVFIDPLNKQTYLKGMTHRRVKQMIRGIVTDMAGVEGEAKVISTHPIKINVSGQAKMPGTILVPPYFTFWQSLMMSKGPSTLGSIRDIRLVRKGKPVFNLDIYSYLKTGEMPDVAITENDLIFFAELENVVEIRGIVRRPGLYELKKTESLADLVKHAGNLSNKDISPLIQVERTIPIRERTPEGPTRRVIDLEISGTKWGPFQLHDGDIISERQKTVTIENYAHITGGGINVPGRYSFTQNENSLWHLIQKAGGLIEGHSKNLEIVRITPEGPHSIHFKMEDEELAKSFMLLTGDNVLTYHESEFKDHATIKVSGFVRKPIIFPYADSLTLLNVLQRSGGIKDGAIPYVYIKKTDDKNNIRYEKIMVSDAGEYIMERRDEVIAFGYHKFHQKFPVVALMEGREPLSLEYTDDLSLEIIIHRLGGLLPNIDSSRVEVNAPDFSSEEVFVQKQILPLNEKNLQSTGLISSGALIIFRTDASKSAPEFVHLIGEFVNPGSYALRSKKETLKSLLDLAGGITNRANPYSIYIERMGAGRIPIPIRKTNPIKFEGAWLLTRNDRIHVSRNDYTVEISGAVFNPGVVSYNKGYSWKDYVNSGAGGPLDTADIKKTYIIYPSGTTVKAKKGWFSSSEVVLGSEIVVPMKPYVVPQEAPEFDSKEFFAGVTSTLTAVTSLLTIWLLITQLQK
ncbi:SLBB domain-containing protein [Fibrobacterota bacterium]